MYVKESSTLEKKQKLMDEFYKSYFNNILTDMIIKAQDIT
jgi:hypothetical protein